ncbi:MAG: tetratricopeptide repeat protein [Candidatus Eisenbacteria bacterium]
MFTKAARCVWNGTSIRMLLLLPLLLTFACSPRLAGGPGANVNPVEILEKSPRIYHIGFETIADSMETLHASAYLAGGLVGDLKAAAVEAGSLEHQSDAARVQTEYFKARRRYDAGASGIAVKHLRLALGIDPEFRPAQLLSAEMFLDDHKVKEAVGIYGRILNRDFTDSDALVGLARCLMLMGRLEEARRALIDAVIFDRVNLGAWQNLHVLGEVRDFTVATHDAPELGMTRKSAGRHYDIVVDASLEDCPVQAAAWIVFASQRAVWRYEGKHKRYLGVPRYVHTYEEDIDCYMALATAWKVLSQRDSISCDTRYFDYLDQVAEDGYLVPHVLFDHVCLEDPFAARGFSLETIDGLREYISRYVLVPKG